MNLDPIWPFPDIEPREVQIEALHAAKDKGGFAYFMRQRLGKTWTAYAEFVNLRASNEADIFFLICPNSLKEQWQEAIETVDPFTPIHIYDSSRKKFFEHFLSKPKSSYIIIINYESMKAFMSANYWNIIDTARTYLCADESTKIKEPTKRMSKAALELAAICKYTRVLTGKPRANSNTDLWAQLKFIRATQRNYFQHKHTFSLVGGWQGKQVLKDINIELLQREMAPHCYIAPDKYLRGFEKIYEPLRKITLKGEQKEIYATLENDLVAEIMGDKKITAPIVLVKYLRLQQISSGIAGDMDGEQHNIIPPEDNPKIQETLELLETEIDKKVLIVCRFRLSIDNLYKILTKKGFKVAKMIGGMGPRIEEEKRKFNNEDYDILLAQIQVLSFGHTLCGNDDYPCDSIIFFENDFSLINRAQCESRPEKMGRDIPISIYDMFASKMDKYIVKSLIKKEEASLALMGYARERGILNLNEGQDGSTGAIQI